MSSSIRFLFILILMVIVSKVGDCIFDFNCVVYMLIIIQAITSTGIKKGDAFLADVNSQLKNKNLTTDVKVDTNSNVSIYFSFAILLTSNVDRYMYGLSMFCLNLFHFECNS